MSENLLLIDGHSILNRAFYGVPDLTNVNGLHTNAIYGFLNMMFKAIEEEQPDYLAVAFDLHHPTFRHEMYEEYKGTRKPMPQELYQQVDVMKEVLRAMDITIVEMPGYEADDILGTMAKKGEQEEWKVVILSGDRDLLQLATKNTIIRIPHTKGGTTTVDHFDQSGVEEKYFVTPAEFIDVKALMGDSSDNIPGVPSIGEKTATKLIQAYHSLENLYEHVEEVTPPRAKKALLENKELAFLCQKLVRICVEVPLKTELSTCRLGDIYTEEAYHKISELGFKSLLGRFSKEISSQSAKIEQDFQKIDKIEEASKWIQEAAKQQEVGIYVFERDAYRENEQLVLTWLLNSQEKKKKLLGMAVAYTTKEDGGKAVFISTSREIGDEHIEEWLSILGNSSAILCVLDIKRHLRFQRELKESQVFDAQLGAYLLNPLSETYHYDELAALYCSLNVPSRSQFCEKKTDEQFMEENEEDFVKMACYLAYTAVASKKEIYSQCEKYGMVALLEDVEIPLAFALYDMEQEGVLVKREALREYGEKLAVGITELENKIYHQVGEEFNINSPKQLGVILFEKMGIEGGKKTKTGYSTSAEILEKLKGDYPVVADILEYRQLTKLKSTYADGLAVYIGEDERIHGTFNQTITATGRISSTEPNLQNIPIRMELGREIRKIFVPKEGCIFLDADYSQIELRILAHFSEDEHLIGAYKNGEDIHSATASKVFHVPLDQVDSDLRRKAKAVNFGIVYGISAFGLSNDLNIDRKEAAEYINQYFAIYPKIKEFLDNSVETAKTQGYVQTAYHRIRPVPELKSSNFMQRSFGERVAMNSPIQGTAADIIKLAMIHVHHRLLREGLQSRIVLQVHDELLVETKIEEKEQVEKILREEMMGVADLLVPLSVEVESGESWFDAH